MDKKLCFEKLKKLVILFLFGVFGGCIYFNVLWRIQGALFQNEWGMTFDRILNRSMIELFGGLNQYAVWILIFHIIMGILGLTRIGKVLAEGCVICTGFLAGAGQTLLLLCFDVKEGVVFLIKMILAIFVPAVMIGIAFVLVCTMSSLKWTSWNKTKKWKYIQVKKYLFFFFGTLILHMVYIFVCSYVNFEKISGKIFMG